MAKMVSKAVDLIQRDGYSTFLRKGGGMVLRKGTKVRPIDELCFRHSLRRLRSYQRDEYSITDVLDTVYQFSGIGQYQTLAPIQVQSELAAAADFVTENNPEVVVEIGTANGGTFYTWCRGFNDSETVVSIDLPSGSTPTRFLDKSTPETETEFIRNDSHARETHDELKRILDGRSIDFLFIDGDHTLEGVKRDFELYEPLVDDDGVIAFHDIITIEADPWNQVDRFWEEIKTEYDTHEIIDENYDPHDPITIAGVTVTGHGIGILQK